MSLYAEVILDNKDNSKSDLGTCELTTAKYKIQTRRPRFKKNSKESHIHLLLLRLTRNQIY